MTSTPSSVAPVRRLPRLAAAIVALAVVAGGVVGLAEPAAAAVVHKGSVPAGTTLQPGDSVTSPNGQFRLILQGDGNFVEYGVGNRVLWASNTSDQPGAVVTIGRNRAVDLVRNGKRILRWASAGTVQSTSFAVRADGTMGLYAGKTAIVNWTSQQGIVAAGNSIYSGTVLSSDSSGARRLTMQADGNLVQTVNRKVVWQSGTGGHKGAWAELRKDGNFAVVGRDAAQKKVTIWSSRTGAAGAGTLMVQVDGNVVLYGGKDTRVWSTKPVTGLMWPVASTKISGRYGDDRGAGHVPRYHQGADAPVAVGTPVYASGTGTVTSVVANNASYGNYIVVTYGNVTVLTAHLSSIGVKQGQIVSLSSQIGKSGNTGQSTGPHVHVETRRAGVLFDPLTLLHFR